MRSMRAMRTKRVSRAGCGAGDGNWSGGLGADGGRMLGCGMLDGSLLLCEDCGYQLDGLPRSVSCPECGRPLESSHPDGRVGSAWQQRPGIAGWARTVLRVLRHPKAIWGEVRVESRRSVALMLVNFGVAAALVPVSISIKGAQFGAASPVYALVFYVVAFDLLLLLTLIESVGIRTFAKRRKWRVTRAVADAVCGHASAGWILSGLGVAVAWHVAQYMEGDRVAAWIAGATGQRLVLNTSEVGVTLLIGFLGMGLMVGLLTFEFLVYFGVRRMKFANAPSAGLAIGAARAVAAGNETRDGAER